MKKLEFRPNQTIVFDGDSLTALRLGGTLDQWPWLRISNSHRSWADTFSELLFAWRPDLNLTFRTAAVGGSSCRELAARFDEVIGTIQPDWVFMTIGGNDATREIPLDEFEGKLRDYCTKVAVWGGRVVFVYGFKPCPNARQENIEKSRKRIPYYEVQERLAGQMANAEAIEVGTAMLRKAELHYQKYPGHSVYSDGTHFSNLGGMIVAGEVLKACGILSAED